MRRILSQVSKATGIQRTFPSVHQWLEFKPVVTPSSSNPAALSPNTNSNPTARFDQALADIAAITKQVKQRNDQAINLNPPNGLPASSSPAGSIPSSTISSSATTTVSSSASSSSLPPPSTLFHYLPRYTNRELNDLLTGHQLFQLAQVCYLGNGSPPPATSLSSSSSSSTTDKSTALYIPRDIQRASKLYILAANKGDLSAVLTVALASVDGLGIIPKDYQRAYGLLHNLVTKTHHPWGYYALATLLLRKQIEELSVITKDNNKSFTSNNYHLHLSSIPPEQKILPVNVQILSYYRKAAESLQVPPAWLNLANCLSYGIGCLPDGLPVTKEAVYWLEYAANKGDPLAAAQYAEVLTTKPQSTMTDGTTLPPTNVNPRPDFGLLPNDKEAAKYWRIAAIAGHPSAQHNLGVAYMKGIGPGCETNNNQPDPVTALIWFRRAANHSQLFRSVMNAGAILERGIPPNIPRNLPEALDIYTKALSAQLQYQDKLRQSSSLPLPQNIQQNILTLRKRINNVQKKLYVLDRSQVPNKVSNDHDNAIANDLDNENDYDLVLEFDTPEIRNNVLKTLYADNNSSITGNTLVDIMRTHTVTAPVEDNVVTVNGKTVKEEETKNNGPVRLRVQSNKQ